MAMKKLLLTSIAALFLATGTARAAPEFRMKFVALIGIIFAVVGWLFAADYGACWHHRWEGGALATPYEIQCEARYGAILPEFIGGDDDD